MKKILITIIFITLPLLMQAQLNGSGTWADPWSGTLDGDATWNGTKYINGDITVDDETLTISAGAIIIFLAEGTDLIITATGQIEANGSSGNMIRFTADDDDDGNYGETGERWGHISFQSMGAAGSSIIDNCIIEYCYTDDGVPGLGSFGGGIYAGFSDLTISSSTLKNNHAGYGGAIFIKDNTSPTLERNLIYNNTASKGGGGVFIHSYVNSIIENCIITYNTVSGAGGGGGIYLGPYTEDTKILNTIISKNSSVNLFAENIVFNNNTLTDTPSFINCIIWGSNFSINYANQTPSSSDFINCAIQNPVSGSTTNCITLNASNTNVSGPNFVATDGSNWLIQPWSPCIDIGNGADPDIPTLDYLGNGRIGNVDIGAYENQYYRWQGDDLSNPDLWSVSENWNSGSAPASGVSVYIPSSLSNYPTGSTPDFTIGASNALILEPGAKATFGTLSNSGTLKLESDASNIASLILDSYTDNGSEEIQLFLTGGGAKTTYKWHYISSPVTSLPVDTFVPGPTKNLAQWIEDRPSTSLTQGWVAYDGWIYSSQAFGGPTFTTLDAGKGYNYFKTIDTTYTFGGTLNTGNVNASLSYTSGNDDIHGYNLIGNPFTSGLDWDYIITNSFPDYTTKSLYFTRNNVLCSYIAGVGVPGDVTGIIPPMQGFFTKTYSTGNTIVLAAAARTHNNIHATYKGTQVIPLVRLALSDSTISDETVVRFDDLAKSYLDNDFDALKLFLDPGLPSIYSSFEGTNYTINGLPFPETLVEIPVTINIATDSTPKIITASQLQGLDNYDVTLTDNSTGFTADLRTTPSVTFAAPKGTTTDRFVLKISAITTGTENPTSTNNLFNIYPANSFINIQTISDEWEGKSGSVRVLDLAGRTMTDLQNSEFRKNSILQVQSPGAKGLYVVEIRSGALRYVGKVVVR